MGNEVVNFFLPVSQTINAINIVTTLAEGKPLVEPFDPFISIAGITTVAGLSRGIAFDVQPGIGVVLGGAIGASIAAGRVKIAAESLPESEIKCIYCRRDLPNITKWEQLGTTYMDDRLTHVYYDGKYYRFEGSDEYWCSNDTPRKRKQKEVLKLLSEEARKEKKKELEKEHQVNLWKNKLENIKKSIDMNNMEKIDGSLNFLKQPDDNEEKKDLDIQVNEANTDMMHHFECVKEIMIELAEFENRTKRYLEETQKLQENINSTSNITIQTLHIVLSELNEFLEQHNIKLLIELKSIIECQIYEPNNNTNDKSITFWNKLENLIKMFIESGEVYLENVDAFLVIISQIMQNPSQIDENMINPLKKFIQDETKTNTDTKLSQITITPKNIIDEFFNVIKIIPGSNYLKNCWEEMHTLTRQLNTLYKKLQHKIDYVNEEKVNEFTFTSINDDINYDIIPNIDRLIIEQKTNVAAIKSSRHVTGIHGDNLIAQFIQKIEHLGPYSSTNIQRNKMLKNLLSTFGIMLTRCNKKCDSITICDYFKDPINRLDDFIQPLNNRNITILDDLAKYAETDKFKNDLLPYLENQIKRSIDNRERRKLRNLTKMKYSL